MATEINGQEYNWEDTNIVFGNRILLGVLAIDYKTTQEKEHSYGKGNKPYGKKRGKKGYPISITLKQSEVIAIQRQLAKGKDLTDIIENMTVSYAPAGGAVTTDFLKGVEFTEDPRNIGVDNPEMEIVLPGLCDRILRNV